MKKRRYRLVKNYEKLLPTEVELHDILKQTVISNQDITDEHMQKVLVYIMHQQKIKGGQALTEDEIIEQLNQMLLDTVIEHLMQKGLLELDFSGDTVDYNLTDLGKERIKNLKNGKKPHK